MLLLNKDTWSTRTMVKISVLGVISYVLMYFKFPTWFAPPFLKMDIADVPSLIGAFAMGPMAGVVIQFLKNILNLVFEGTSTMAVGELTNFIVGSIFAYTAGMFYYRKKDFANAMIGLGAGIVAMTVIISLANYFFIFPLYASLFGWPMEQLVEMGTVLNKNVVDLKSMIVFAVVPFNILKGIITAAITILVYKRVSPILHK